MIKKRLLGVALAAIAMFLWGFAYWAGLGSVVSPMKTLPAEKEQGVVDALTTSETATDVYYIPGIPPEHTAEASAAWTEKNKQGPIVGLIFVKDGKHPMAPSMMFQGFVHMLFTAFGLAFVLCFASGRLPTYGKRVLFVGFVGFLTAFWVNIGEIIWMFHPVGNAMFNFGYHVTGILVAGLVLAAFVKDPAT